MTPEIIRHGEVIMKPSVLPEGAMLQEESKTHIVAHSETGHHHVLEVPKITKDNIKVYMHNGTKYIEVPTIADLWHQKTGQDVHKTHKVAPAVYEIVIKREFDYFAKAIRAVRD